MWVGKQSPSLTKTPQQGIQEPGVGPQRPTPGTGPPVTAGPEQPSRTRKLNMDQKNQPLPTTHKTQTTDFLNISGTGQSAVFENGVLGGRLIYENASKQY